MKRIFSIFPLILIFLNSQDSLAASFVNPITFKGSEAEKKEVVEYIKENTKEQYCSINMCSNSVLRMMENQNMTAFKKLLKASDKTILSNVIKQYCSIGMCNYSTLNMMYNQELQAKSSNLKF